MTTIVGMLVAEDAARAPIAQMLRNHGLQVIEASSADEAWALAHFGRLHCVITHVGRADGLSLCRRLRDTTVTAALPVVLVSDGSGISDDHLRAVGVTEVLSPQRIGEDLLAAIHRAIA